MDCILKKIFEPKTVLYKLEELENTGITEIERTDMEIKSSRDRIMKASLWKKPKTSTKKILILLCGNMGNKKSAIYLLKNFIPKDISLATLEYNGRGYSERLPISYSIHEKNDVNIFIEFINQKFGYKKFAIWGRSMGAAISLAYFEKFHFKIDLKRDYCVKMIIADSPFFNFENVLKTKLGNMFFVSMFAGKLLEKIKKKTKEKYDFKLEDIDTFGKEIREDIKIQNKIPIKVIGSPEDELCKFEYVKEFYEILTGERELIQVDGNHAKERDAKLIQKIVDTIIDNLNK